MVHGHFFALDHINTHMGTLTDTQTRAKVTSTQDKGTHSESGLPLAILVISLLDSRGCENRKQPPFPASLSAGTDPAYCFIA